MLNLVSVFSNDFVSFGSRLGSLLALSGEPLESWSFLGPPSGCQRGSKEDAKRGLGAKVAPSRLWDLIWGALGPLLGRFLGGFWAAKWEPKGFNKGAKPDFSDEIAPSRM